MFEEWAVVLVVKFGVKVVTLLSFVTWVTDECLEVEEVEGLSTVVSWFEDKAGVVVFVVLFLSVLLLGILVFCVWMLVFGYASNSQGKCSIRSVMADAKTIGKEQKFQSLLSWH